MNCRTCIHQSVCYLVDSHGLTDMSFNVNKFGCSDYIGKDAIEQLEKENKELKEKLTK